MAVVAASAEGYLTEQAEVAAAQEGQAMQAPVGQVGLEVIRPYRVRHKAQTLQAAAAMEEIQQALRLAANTVAAVAGVETPRLTAQGKKVAVLFMVQGEEAEAVALLQLLAVVVRLVHGELILPAKAQAVRPFRVNMGVAMVEMVA